MKCKNEEDENSINSETFENEEKIIQKKIMDFSQVNLMNCNNIAKNVRINYDRDSNLNGIFIFNKEYSLISNQINSNSMYSEKIPNIFNNKSLYSGRETARSVVFASTGDNSHSNSLTQKPNLRGSYDNMGVYMSPERKKEISKLDNKLLNSYSKNDEQSNQEIKKLSLVMKLKEKEIDDMLQKYKSLKEKYNETKTNFDITKEKYSTIKRSNINLKKMICQMIKKKHEINN